MCLVGLDGVLKAIVDGLLVFNRESKVLCSEDMSMGKYDSDNGGKKYVLRTTFFEQNCLEPHPHLMLSMTTTPGLSSIAYILQSCTLKSVLTLYADYWMKMAFTSVGVFASLSLLAIKND